MIANVRIFSDRQAARAEKFCKVTVGYTDTDTEKAMMYRAVAQLEHDGKIEAALVKARDGFQVWRRTKRNGK